MIRDTNLVRSISKAALWVPVALGLLLGSQVLLAEMRSVSVGGVSIEAMEVSTIQFKKAIQRADAKGGLQAYDRAMRLLFTGEFPPYSAYPFELYIGDYRVEEYSGNRTELQVILFDPDLVEKLEGQELRVRPPGGELQALGVAFSRGGLQPVTSAPKTR